MSTSEAHTHSKEDAEGVVCDKLSADLSKQGMKESTSSGKEEKQTVGEFSSRETLPFLSKLRDDQAEEKKNVSGEEAYVPQGLPKREPGPRRFLTYGGSLPPLPLKGNN
jgi:hypothetical protein